MPIPCGGCTPTAARPTPPLAPTVLLSSLNGYLGLSPPMRPSFPYGLPGAAAPLGYALRGAAALPSPLARPSQAPMADPKVAMGTWPRPAPAGVPRGPRRLPLALPGPRHPAPVPPQPPPVPLPLPPALLCSGTARSVGGTGLHRDGSLTQFNTALSTFEHL